MACSMVPAWICSSNRSGIMISFVQTEAEVDEAISQVVKVGVGTSLIIAYPK